MIRGLLAGVVAAPIVGAMLVYSLANWRLGPEPPPYAFELPRMFFQCMEFPMPKSGDTIPSWKFEQAVFMNFIDFKGVVYMPGNYNLGSGCGFHASTTLARGTARSLTFGKNGEVMIEQYKPDPQ